MVAISNDGPVWTLDLGDDENRFSPGWLAEVGAALDRLEASPEPAVLVTTAQGKFWSNGLDLDWLGQHPDEYASYVDRVQSLFARVLTLPVPTVAAVSGHAFGAGAMLAMAHDYRVMREDRGYFCFPEVDILIPFTRGMDALITSKLTPRVALDAMATGRRWSGPEAAAVGLVDAAAPLEQLPEVAGGFVVDLAGKDRTTLGTIKARMFARVVDALLEPTAG
ncbi:MAG: putative enoyl-CoA hydratase echA17 [Nocardioides sp.]|nr:putative enoyl-CoA hydratase echA17 [Nocardioides sp.]